MSRRTGTGRTQPHPGRSAKQPWIPMGRAERIQNDKREAGLRRALTKRGVPIEAIESQIAELVNAEIWMNNHYTVHVTRRPEGDEHAGSVYELSIRRNDRAPARDWRDFQRIKNEIAGPLCEAVELYPAQTRVVDTANQYFLWVFPEGVEVPVGFPRGMLMDHHEHDDSGAVQRELPQDWIDEAAENQTLHRLKEDSDA